MFTRTHFVGEHGLTIILAANTSLLTEIYGIMARKSYTQPAT